MQNEVGMMSSQACEGKWLLQAQLLPCLCGNIGVQHRADMSKGIP